MALENRLKKSRSSLKDVNLKSQDHVIEYGEHRTRHAHELIHASFGSSYPRQFKGYGPCKYGLPVETLKRLRSLG